MSQNEVWRVAVGILFTFRVSHSNSLRDSLRRNKCAECISFLIKHLQSPSLEHVIMHCLHKCLLTCFSFFAFVSALVHAERVVHWCITACYFVFYFVCFV